MKPGPALFVPAAATVLAFLAECASAGPPMLPLEIGNQWDFVDDAGHHSIETITGTRTILGRSVFVKSYTLGRDDGLENWWLTGPNGEVLLAGFDRRCAPPCAGSGFTLAYEPPITFCGASPSVGDVWKTHVVAYDMTDMSVYAEYDRAYGALEEVALTVPAGTFASVGVGQVLVSSCARLSSLGLSLAGTSLAGTTGIVAGAQSDHWYSPGIGMTQYYTDQFWRLAGYGSVTPTRLATWADLKTRYR